MLGSRLSLLTTAIAPAEHPSDKFSPRPRSNAVVDEEEAECCWMLEEVSEDGDVVNSGRLVRSVVNASGGLCS